MKVIKLCETPCKGATICDKKCLADIDKILSDDSETFVLDLSNTRYINSVFLSRVIVNRDRVALACASPEAKTVMRMLRVDTMLNIADTIAEAVKLLENVTHSDKKQE
jgi:hypothetical protein